MNAWPFRRSFRSALRINQPLSETHRRDGWPRFSARRGVGVRGAFRAAHRRRFSEMPREIQDATARRILPLSPGFPRREVSLTRNLTPVAFPRYFDSVDRRRHRQLRFAAVRAWTFKASKLLSEATPTSRFSYTEESLLLFFSLSLYSFLFLSFSVLLLFAVIHGLRLIGVTKFLSS